MTDQELQPYCNQNVELKYDGQVVLGKLVCDGAAQIITRARYSIESRPKNARPGRPDGVLASIGYAEAVEWVRIVSRQVMSAAVIELRRGRALS